MAATATPLLRAQSTNVPEVPGTTRYDAQHLKDRPYDESLPKPIYPSSARVQKEFVVRYIYDYSLSSYTPAVKLPHIPPAQADRSTPEAALVAMISAIQAGDFESWLLSWDAPAQKTFATMAKQQKRDAAFWKKAWDASFGGKDVFLVDRIETVGYVILDARLALPGRPNEGTPFPTVFRHINNQWLATNDLSTSTFLGSWQPGLAGIDNRVSPAPMTTPEDAASQQAQAQGEFLHNHALVPNVTRAAK